jgi:hypothetical protein
VRRRKETAADRAWREAREKREAEAPKHFVRTAPVAPDVPPPATVSNDYTEGWLYNLYTRTVAQTWSSSSSHGAGTAADAQRPYRGGSQGSRSLYSTKLLALQALRWAVECEAALQLYDIDRQIEEAGASKGSSVGADNPQLPAGWHALTDADRDAAFHTLPDMLDGFLQKWGWLHFAKAVEAQCAAKNPPAGTVNADLLAAAEAVLRAASDCGRPPNRHAYTTSGLGVPFEQLHAAVRRAKGLP